MNEAERMLIEELKIGKEEAFDTFLNLYGSRLHSFASRMCRNSEDAKDVVQETLIAVFRSLKNFRGEGTFRAWLFTIATNACGKMRRKSKFEPEEELSLDDFMPTAQGSAIKPDIADWSQNPDELFQREELQAVVETAIAELPKKYRIVLVLRNIEQLSTEETAEALGLSLRTLVIVGDHLSGQRRLSTGLARRRRHGSRQGRQRNGRIGRLDHATC